MPRVNMISEHVAILVVEQLLSDGLINIETLPGRQVLVDSVMRAGEVWIGEVFIPKGRYGDWFEEG